MPTPLQQALSDLGLDLPNSLDTEPYLNLTQFELWKLILASTAGFGGSGGAGGGGGSGGGSGQPAADAGEAEFFAVPAGSTNGTEVGVDERPSATPGMEIYIPTGSSFTYGTGLSGETRSTPPSGATVAGPTILGIRLRPNVSVYTITTGANITARWV